MSKTKSTARARRYYLANKEKVRAYYKDWAAKNKQKVRGYSIRHRDLHKAEIRATQRARLQRIRSENRDLLRAIKMKAECSRCGLRDHRCLDAHHVDRTFKEFNISRAIGSKRWSVILRELAKCIWLCRNCHQIVTLEEKPWVPMKIGIVLPPQEVRCEIIDMFKREQSS